MLLSRFAGAAEELDGAVRVNPFFIDSFADAICAALDMPEHERITRMELMRDHLRSATIDDWLDAVMSAAASVAEHRASAV